MPFLIKPQGKFVFQSRIEQATFHLSTKYVNHYTEKKNPKKKKNITCWEKLAIAR